MLPPIESIQTTTRYSTLVHVKARVENLLAGLRKDEVDLGDRHRKFWRTDEGRKFRSDQHGIPYPRRQPHPLVVQIGEINEAQEKLREYLVAVTARMNEISPPPVVVPKKIKLYEEPWYG